MLHGLAFRVRHSRSWKSCTFSFLPGLVAKTQNPFVPDSHSEFLVPSLDDFIGDDGDELLLCSIRALQKYLSQTEQYCPGIEACLSPWDDVRRGCPITPFPSGCDLSSPCLMRPLQRRIVVLYGSEHTKSGS